MQLPFQTKEAPVINGNATPDDFLEHEEDTEPTPIDDGTAPTEDQHGSSADQLFVDDDSEPDPQDEEPDLEPEDEDDEGNTSESAPVDKNGFDVVAHGWPTDKNGHPLPMTSWWYNLFGVFYKVPPALNEQDRRDYLAMAEAEAAERRKEEQKATAEAALQQRKEYRLALIERLRYLANLGIQPIFCVANVKSATKTGTAIGLGTVIAQYVRNMTLLIPSTANTATATVGQMSGIKGATITVDSYLSGIDKFGAYRQLSQRTPRTDEGLRVIIEDNSGAADEDDANKVKPYVKAVDVTLPNVDALIFDLGNDNISKRSIPLQAARLAHVLIMPFVPDAPVTHRTLRSTITGYNTDKGIPEDVQNELYEKFEHAEATGLDIPTVDKVRHSILVASKTSDEIDFASYALTEQSANTDDLQPWNGTGITVPTEPVWEWKMPNGDLRPFDYSQIQLETDISYLELAVAGYELAGHATGVNVGQPLVANLPSTPANDRWQDAT